MATAHDRRSGDGDGLRERVRRAHRRYPTGVTIVTTQTDGGPVGLACNAFASVSLDPPLVLVCVNTATRSHEHLHAGEHIGINVLACDQADLARRFAMSSPDKFAGVPWEPGAQTGVPLLFGTVAAFETVIQQRIPAGTHTIFVCEVVAAQESEREPLLYVGGAYVECAAYHQDSDVASASQT